MYGVIFGRTWVKASPVTKYETLKMTGMCRNLNKTFIQSIPLTKLIKNISGLYNALEDLVCEILL